MKRTSKHKNWRFRKVKLIDQKILHTLGIINTSLELVPRVPIRYAADQSLFAAVSRGRRSRRRVIVRRRSRHLWLRRRSVIRARRRRNSAWVGDLCHALAYRTPYRSRPRRHLQRGTAVSAVHQHHRRRPHCRRCKIEKFKMLQSTRKEIRGREECFYY